MPNNRQATPKQINARPLGDINAAMRDLDMDSSQVRALLDEGKLIGFNISAKGSSISKLRVLTESINNYRQTRGALLLDWPEVFALIVPAGGLVIRGIDLQKYLNCERAHVSQLISDNEFKIVKKGGSGRGNSPEVTRCSFETFLKGRMI